MKKFNKNDLKTLIREILLENDVKVYLNKGEKPPKGKKIQKGPKGGNYYMGSPKTDSPKEKNTKKKNPEWLAKGGDYYLDSPEEKNPKNKQTSTSDGSMEQISSEEYMDGWISDERDAMGDEPESFVKPMTQASNFINSKYPNSKMIGSEDTRDRNVINTIDKLLDAKPKFTKKFKAGGGSSDSITVADYGSKYALLSLDTYGGGAVNVLIIK